MEMKGGVFEGESFTLLLYDMISAFLSNNSDEVWDLFLFFVFFSIFTSLNSHYKFLMKEKEEKEKRIAYYH